MELAPTGRKCEEIAFCTSKAPSAANWSNLIHKDRNLSFFTGIADETPTERNQFVHELAVAFLLAISMKMRYTKTFKGYPLCPMGLYANLTL